MLVPVLIAPPDVVMFTNGSETTEIALVRGWPITPTDVLNTGIELGLT